MYINLCIHRFKHVNICIIYICIYIYNIYIYMIIKTVCPCPGNHPMNLLQLMHLDVIRYRCEK